MIRLYDPDEHWLAKCAMHMLLALFAAPFLLLVFMWLLSALS